MTWFNRRCVIVDLTHVFKRRRALKERSAEQEYAGETSHKHWSLSTSLVETCCEPQGSCPWRHGRSPPKSCKDVTWGRGISPLIFVEKNLFEKVIEKKQFGAILRILLVETFTPPPKTKMSIAVIVKRRFYMIFRWFAMEDYVKKVKILNFCGHGRRGPWGRHFSKKFTFHLPQKNFLIFLETKVDSSAKFTDDLF